MPIFAGGFFDLVTLRARLISLDVDVVSGNESDWSWIYERYASACLNIPRIVYPGEDPLYQRTPWHMRLNLWRVETVGLVGLAEGLWGYDARTCPETEYRGALGTRCNRRHSTGPDGDDSPQGGSAGYFACFGSETTAGQLVALQHRRAEVDSEAGPARVYNPLSSCQSGGIGGIASNGEI